MRNIVIAACTLLGSLIFTLPGLEHTLRDLATANYQPFDDYQEPSDDSQSHDAPQYDDAPDADAATASTTATGKATSSTKVTTTITTTTQILPRKGDHHVVFSQYKCGVKNCSQVAKIVEENSRLQWNNMTGISFLDLSSAIETNKFGAPILRSMYLKAAEIYPNATTYTYINGDLLPRQDFLATLNSVTEKSEREWNNTSFMIIGARVDVDWNNHKASLASSEEFRFDKFFATGKQHADDAQDYFCVSRHAIDWATIPDFVIGRIGFDTWLVDYIHHREDVHLVDATLTLKVIHQNDEMGSKSQGGKSVKQQDGPDFWWNHHIASPRNIKLKPWADHGFIGEAAWFSARAADGSIVIKPKPQQPKQLLSKQLGIIRKARLPKHLETPTRKIAYNAFPASKGPYISYAVSDDEKWAGEDFESFENGDTIECSNNKLAQDHLDVISGCLESKYADSWKYGRTNNTVFRMVTVSRDDEGRKIQWTDQTMAYRAYITTWHHGTSDGKAQGWAGLHVFFRYRTSDDLYVASMLYNGKVAIRERRNGKFTTLATGTLPSNYLDGSNGTLAAGKWIELKASAIGSELTFDVDGVQILSVTSDTFSWGTTGVRTDYADVYLDDLEMGY